MARTKQAPVETIDSVQLLMREKMRGQVNRPNLYAYKPHTKQHIFHSALHHKRLYIGGNRSGKTTGGVVEDIYWLIKRHPYRSLPLPEGPIRGRVVSVDFNYGVQQIILPEFQRWLPPSFLKNGSWEDSYNKEFRILSLANGSTVEFKSYDQDLEKFAGTSRHFTHYDEEAPHHIYNECEARLIDTNGYSWMTMTPVEGMSWVYDTLYVPGVEKTDPDIFVVEIDMAENPYIDKEASERYLSGLSKDDRLAREKGKFVHLGGLVFKEFDKETHVVDSHKPPLEWTWWVSIDHGYNNPSAILWHAVSPDGAVVTFDEIYKNEKTVDELAAEYHAKNKAWGKTPFMVVGDPAMKQRNAVTGTNIIQEYAKNGIFVAEANNEVASGINRMAQYLRLNRNNQPTWTITENCTNLIREMQRLRWATWQSKKAKFENNVQEKIHKKDDHACDSARYFFTFMPELNIGNDGTKQPGQSNPLGGVTGVPPVGRIDTNLRQPVNTGWDVASAGTDLQGFEY